MTNKSVSATHAVAKINNVDIIIIENGEEMVPVKPICEALGIASNSQIERIKSNPILGSTNMICISVGADGKDREMFALPLKYIFGWLFTIDSEKVKPEAREAVLKYQTECYDVLYNHFVGARKFLELKETATEALVRQQKIDRTNFYSAKETLKNTTEKLEEVACMTYQEYIENNRQLTIQFPQEG